MTTVGVVGLGYWGPNLARNYDDLARCLALRRRRGGARHGSRRATHTRAHGRPRRSARRPRAGGGRDRHSGADALPAGEARPRGGQARLVEKPPAMHGDEMEELVALAEERDLTLMPGHLLLYHPAVRKLKELVDSGELGEVLCVYGNRQNLGIVRTNENALWSLGVHDLSVILYLLGEDPVEAVAHGRDFLTEGVEDVVFCYLRFPSGKIAHMHLSWLDPHKMRRLTVVGDSKMAVFDDMELERKVTVYEKGAVEARRNLRRVADAQRRHLHPEDPDRRAAAARMPGVPAPRARRRRPAQGGQRRRNGRARPRTADRLALRGAGLTPRGPGCHSNIRRSDVSRGLGLSATNCDAAGSHELHRGRERRRLPRDGDRRGLPIADSAVLGSSRRSRRARPRAASPCLRSSSARARSSPPAPSSSQAPGSASA